MKTKAKILSAFTLCDADCEGGYHNPKRMTCQRCGAKLHVRLYEVQTNEGEELIVGRECLKDTLGYLPNTYHARAKEVAEELAKVWAVRPGVILEEWGNKRVAVKDCHNGRIFTSTTPNVPHNFTRSLMRAGADLGYWTYPKERQLKFSRISIPQVEWIGCEL